MKYFLLLVISSAGFSTTAQELYSIYCNYDGTPGRSFQRLVTEGIAYVRSGDEELDESYETALEAYWTCTPYRAIDIKEEPITDTTILLLRTTSGLCLINAGNINKNGAFIVNSSHINVYTRGFCPGAAAGDLFVEQALSAMNTFIEFENRRFTGKTPKERKDIDWRTTQELNKEILAKRGKVLKEKPLLLIEGNRKKVSHGALTKFGITTRSVTLEEYKKMDYEERSGYCLFSFFHSKQETDYINIYDLKDNSLVFTKEYLNSKTRFSGLDLKIVEEYW